MIGMTQMVVTATSQMLLQELDKTYKPNNVVLDIEKHNGSIIISFPVDIHNEEKEGIFATVIEKIRHLKDPQDRKMETKIIIKYLQQANKEYYFSRGELVRYRGFMDTDDPLPLVTNLMLSLNS